VREGKQRAGKTGNSPSCPAASIFSLLSLNCDCLCRTYLIKEILFRENNNIQLLITDRKERNGESIKRRK